MEALETARIIRPELLESRHYFRSLAGEAYRCGLLSEKKLTALQNDLLALLAAQADRWSRGGSSSIPTERAQELMTSILFVLGLKLKSYKTPEEAAAAMASEPLTALFEGGMRLVQRKMTVSRCLQKSILNELFDTPNVFYRSTVSGGIDGFFRLYRPQFAAHEIHITADYPVLMGRPEADGIEFIEKYLRCIQAENAFCTRFAPRDVHRLLCGLTRDYAGIPMNLFEPVLLCALALTLSGREAERLDLTQDDVSYLNSLFCGKSKTQVQDCLGTALSRLGERMDVPPVSASYAALCLPGLSTVILNAVKTETLDKVFLIAALGA